jgi:hypothetical protein
MPELVRVWQQTPKEWFACIRPTATKVSSPKVVVEKLPFKDKKRKLPESRFQGLATLMLAKWITTVPSVPRLTLQPVNIGAIKVFMKAIKKAIAWAEANGEEVPLKVKQAWGDGEEEAEILSGLIKIESASGH